MTSFRIWGLTAPQLEEVLRALKEIRDMPSRRRVANQGICGMLRRTIIGIPELGGMNTATLVMHMSASWPERSGSLLYPVPSPVQGGCPWSAYSEAFEAGTLWDRRTYYGRARWALLLWMIHRVEYVLKADLHSRSGSARRMMQEASHA